MVFEPKEKKMVMIEPSVEEKLKQPMLKKHRGVWWEKCENPMADADFVREFCNHVFATTKDMSVVTVRNRVYRFIRNFMSHELDAELTKYREDYP